MTTCWNPYGTLSTRKLPSALDVAERFPIKVAILFLGAARVAAVGPQHLTMTAEEGVTAAHAFPDATIVPLHFEGWAHFSESRPEIGAAFQAAGLADRLHWPDLAAPITLSL